MPKGPKRAKRHAVRVTSIAIGEELEAYGRTPESEGKDPAAVALGRRGGRARAEALSARERKEIAQKAASSRWARHDRKTPTRAAPMVRERRAGAMSESLSNPPLLNFLIGRFAALLVPLYLEQAKTAPPFCSGQIAETTLQQSRTRRQVGFRTRRAGHVSSCPRLWL